MYTTPQRRTLILTGLGLTTAMVALRAVVLQFFPRISLYEIFLGVFLTRGLHALGVDVTDAWIVAMMCVGHFLGGCIVTVVAARREPSMHVFLTIVIGWLVVTVWVMLAFEFRLGW